jgi:hypothetical protein
MALKKWIETALDEIDAALFTGDSFEDLDNLWTLQEYLAKWQRRADEIAFESDKSIA